MSTTDVDEICRYNITINKPLGFLMTSMAPCGQKFEDIQVMIYLGIMFRTSDQLFKKELSMTTFHAGLKGVKLDKIH